jgi:peptidoglycan/LPS O-acetylase OafA/YrhL
MKYRPEIDGLRAIAVLSVVLFHAGVGPASGFVGVDVFFVISGYLITRLLHEEFVATGRISLSAFYARRARRLFAALVVVVGATLLVSLVVLSPYGEVKRVADSAAASLAFVANFHFDAVTGDYFDGRSELLPLLHLWSLSVEEQFYLAWPLLLLGLLRLSPKSARPVLVGLSIASLAYSEWLVRLHPESAFFQTPARAFELAAGCFVALRPVGGLAAARKVALAGLLIVGVAVCVRMPTFPGLGAVPAVLGAALVLMAVHGSEDLGAAGALLKSRPMVFFGLISYSLYLWHWPLLALYRATHVGEAAPGVRLALCLAAVVLAWLSYRFVERPFRKPDPTVADRKVVAAALAASFALGFLSLTVGNGYDRKPPPDDLASRIERDQPANRSDCHLRGDQPLPPAIPPACRSDADKPIRVAIWGDSHALAWQPFAWELARQDDAAALSLTRDSCPPALGYLTRKPVAEAALCREFNEWAQQQLDGVHTLILAGRWPSHLAQADDPAAAAAQLGARLDATLKAVRPRVARILLLGPSPVLRDEVPRCIRSGHPDRCAVTREEYDAYAAASRAMLQRLAAANPGVEYVEVADFFCGPTTCPPLKDGYGLYWDSNHVSSTAARRFAQAWIEAHPAADAGTAPASTP